MPFGVRHGMRGFDIVRQPIWRGNGVWLRNYFSFFPPFFPVSEKFFFFFPLTLHFLSFREPACIQMHRRQPNCQSFLALATRWSPYVCAVICALYRLSSRSLLVGKGWKIRLSDLTSFLYGDILFLARRQSPSVIDILGCFSCMYIACTDRQVLLMVVTY
jgi:hypothetical protein